ncbi:MAG: bifunctional oligoribonuclease/PAP phosphatase NrnA [Prolixibacteraceae bacterium]|nr:bifunctional oligoribonuclease/PAP phosphatase NrnA [Prolixibacteraceae bacterium]
MKSEIGQIKIKSFKEIVEKSDTSVIVSHVNPDGDAIGSAVALLKILRNKGKNPFIVIPNDIPDFLQWMGGVELITDNEKESEKAKSVFQNADTLFCLDFNDFERGDGIKDFLKDFKGYKVMIDHHPDPKAECDLVISCTSASSTCELLFKVIEEAGYYDFLDKEAADAIYAGMMTDTGNFSYNASEPETYHIIAKLLEKGIDKDLIHSNVYHTFSEDRWRLIGHSLKEKMVILPEFRSGYISLSKEELTRFNFQPGDTEGLVNYPLMVKGIVFCVLFLEKEDQVKVSLRSKGTFSTNDFARKYYKGGGHINASGGSSSLSLDDAVCQFESLLVEYKNDLLNSF